MCIYSFILDFKLFLSVCVCVRRCILFSKYIKNIQSHLIEFLCAHIIIVICTCAYLVDFDLKCIVNQINKIFCLCLINY